MPRDESALVLAVPEDGADVILNKLRSVGASSVQLLVSEGTVALRRPEVIARIGDLALTEGIEVTLITSDMPTVDAANAAGVQALYVPDSRVLAPSRSSRADMPTTPYSTRVIERRQQAQPGRPVPPPRGPRDDLEAPPPPAAAEDDVYAALQGLSAALDDRRPTPADDEMLAASLRVEVEAPPRPAGSARAPLRPAREPAAAPPVPAPAGRTRARRAGRGSWPIVALSLALILLMVAIGALLLWTSRVTVTVAAPVRPDSVEPFEGLPVPIAAPGSDAASAVVAEAVVSDVAVTQPGEVAETTLTPSGSAAGVVNILNSSSQAILLPAGTEFIAVTPDGREVPFTSDAEVLVPGATTADQGAQIVTTRGQAQIPVTARSPGSASNVDANSVRRMTPPGGPTFNTGAGNLIVSNPPIGGGTETEVRVVKDSDVQAILAQALEALDAQARAQLDGIAQARGLAVDASTVAPRRADLERLQGFEFSVDPPVGTTLDVNNPRFSLVVQAAYSALATPPDRPVDRQLGPAVTEVLRQAGELQPGDCRAPTVTGWRWDGESLRVDGQVAPDTVSPRCQGGLDDAALDQVREAVRGRSRAEATAALDALVAEGLIGSYTLPETNQLPRFDWQITVTGQ
jgi:hypothetical protein